MRIHLSLESSLFASSSSSSGPLAQIGDEVVLIELQGELGWEGEKEGGVVGVLGFDRPDKPTLHLGEHHLLHGKIASLPKPLAVIRRAVAPVTEGVEGAVQGDAEEEEELDDTEITERIPSRSKRSVGILREKRQKNSEEKRGDDDDEGEEEEPLFPPQSEAGPSTPQQSRNRHASSSPFPLLPPSSVKDYSSELDFSSPPPSLGKRGRGDSDEEDEDEEEDEAERLKREQMERRRAERRAQKPERTRVYEVVAVVRKKVVFALRPEPIVTATVLPT